MNARSNSWSMVSDVLQLQDLVGRPIRRVAEKSRPPLHELDRQWLRLRRCASSRHRQVMEPATSAPRAILPASHASSTSAQSRFLIGRATVASTDFGTSLTTRTSG
jgi:hypothetical protein